MQNLWHAPVASSSQTHFPGASRINIENNRNSRTQNSSISTENSKLQDDEDDDAQHGFIFYDEDMSYEALLALQERIGDVETGLKKKVISALLMQHRYQSTKMNDFSDSTAFAWDLMMLETN
ncbi:hypothetical protein CQW23_16641 [Capsicum baccatum]|uniref:Uncharacterized protein n=1 Tax=Capsicum baccatum TaxID=33114 RepID=A0A2G2WBH9_CAPBA|nr:hypothetical protein CQW23_16641 [Capsicum baccatum]